MESLTSATEKFTLQPSLTGMHRESLEWLSATALWKREISFFQNLLDKYAPKMESVELKKQIDHFQHLITYYDGELIDLLHKKLRKHEKHLAEIHKEQSGSDSEYYKEHAPLMDEVSSFQKVFTEFKHGFFDLIEKGLA